jgi:hypothetical protein
MSTISVTPVYDGAIIPTETINDNFSKFAEINGSLGALNVAGIDEELDHRHLQLGAASGGTMVGGTVNLDYFNGIRYTFVRTVSEPDSSSRTMEFYDHGYLSFFNLKNTQVDSTFGGIADAVVAGEARTLAIPGASTSFFVPYRAHVLVTWQVSWTSDAARFGPTPRKGQSDEGAPDRSEFTKPNTAIRFFFDGAEHNQASTTRETREAMFGSPMVNVNSGQIPTHALRDRYKSRYWQGHAYIGEVSKGFHTASLRVCAMQHVRQTRVRVRNIKVLYFKT